MQSDTIMISMLTLLGVFDGRVPPEASALLFELYRENGNYYVSLNYRNNSDSGITDDLQLPGRNYIIAYDTLLLLTDTIKQ